MESLKVSTWLSILLHASTALATACTNLSSTFPGQVSHPLDLAYTTTNSLYWDKRCELSPSCIFYPESSTDVATAVQILVATNTTFAAKSGGHMSNPGYNNIDNGVLITFEKMTEITLNDAQDVASIGPGLRWGDVYEELAKYDRIVVGGRVPPVGVSGILLGGGLSYMGFEYGFAADNVVGHEIVLANGTIVYANATQYSDLHKALKGGSSNFGLVTRFDISAYSNAGGWGGSIQVQINDLTNVSAILDAVYDFHVEGSKDKKAGAIPEFIYAPDLLTHFFQIAIWYSDPVDGLGHPAVFDKFFALEGAVANVGPRTLSALAQQSGLGVTENTLEETFRSQSIKADRAAFQEVYDVFTENFEAIGATTTGLLAAVVFQPVSASFIEAGEARGGNVMGLDASNAPYSWICQTVGWSFASDAATVQARQVNITDTYMAYAEAHGVASPYIYMNDADYTQDIFGGYGEENHAFLKQVKAEYDPTGVFTTLLPGGYKI